MRIYQQFLLVLILCTGCTSVPNLLGFTEANSSNEEYNPLIPKENIITKNNQREYMGKLVYKVTDAELSISQAKDFILVVSGLTEHSVAYDPRLILVSTDQPNSLKFSNFSDIGAFIFLKLISTLLFRFLKFFSFV